ncbi:MAG: hypothetical protein KAS93_02510 [Gammaproteobacteria bacterium]|nr:hypothetical protein [Gammaproteobacteria bacterium]
MIRKCVCCLFIIMFSIWSQSLLARLRVRGIYVTQSSLQNVRVLRSLIRRAKAVGINTFVIDFGYSSKRYRHNIKLLHASGIRYVARIVVFPRGGTRAQVRSKNYWRKKYRLVEKAVSLGAQEIQLDYIRYRASMPGSSQNARDILRVIKWFKARLQPLAIPLQIDVFGVAAHGHSRHIGHNLKLFAQSVDAMCPMVYPSHYEPFHRYSRQPYNTVYKSLQALKAQFNGKPPFKVYPFIEASNYRMAMSAYQKQQYIRAQLRAVRDAKADGWFVWSARNKYRNLFRVLR